MQVGIGSDFPLEFEAPAVGPSPHYHFRSPNMPMSLACFLYDSGRSALRMAIRQIGLKQGDTIMIPGYICGSVRQAFIAEGLSQTSYMVGPGVDISARELLKRRRNSKAVLVVDYFGFKSCLRDELHVLNAEGLEVIYDVSHSLIPAMGNPLGCVSAYVASLRKVLPIPDGGIVALCRQNLKVPPVEFSTCEHAVMRTAAMIMKRMYIAGEDKVCPSFREMFLAAEGLLDRSSTIGAISAISRCLLDVLNTEFIVSRRRSNYMTLHSLSTGWPRIVSPLFGLPEADECPLGFPVRVTGRDQLRAFLISRGIYPPVHWPLPDYVSQEFPALGDLSKHILTIPCDQRYDSEDMQRISKALMEWTGRDA